MAAAVPTSEPSEIRAGDSVLWTRTLADYPAPTWALSYVLVGPAQKITIAAAANGTDFAVELTPAVTGPLQAGDYYLTGSVTNGTQVFTVIGPLSIKVLPNFASDNVTAGYDGRSVAKKMLQAIDSAALTAGGNFIVSYTIFGERAVQTWTANERIKWRTYWLGISNQEDQAAAIAAGNTGAGKIYIRRREPR